MRAPVLIQFTKKLTKCAQMSLYSGAVNKGLCILICRARPYRDSIDPPSKCQQEFNFVLPRFSLFHIKKINKYSCMFKIKKNALWPVRYSITDSLVLYT